MIKCFEKRVNIIANKAWYHHHSLYNKLIEAYDDLIYAYLNLNK